MRFVVDKWRRIGTRLYLALGFAVALTLISAAVGVYYFEQSGNLNDKVRSESVPALEAALSEASSLPELTDRAQAVSDAAYDLAEDIDGLASNGGELADAYGAGDALRAELDGLFVVGEDSEEALLVLERAVTGGLVRSS